MVLYLPAGFGIKLSRREITNFCQTINLNSMKKTLLSLIFLLAMQVGASAQQGYNFNQTTGAYTDLVSPTVLTGNIIWDDTSFIVPLGFPFMVGNNTYNSVEIDANGVLIFMSGLNIGVVVALDADLVDRGISAPASPISYQVSGATGSRVFKVEWKNAGFIDGTASDFISFQAWLYEGSNKIEYRYGTSSIGNPGNIFGPAGGPASGIATEINLFVGSLSGVFLQGAPAAATAVAVNNTTTFPSLSGTPANSTVYVFAKGTGVGLPESFDNVKLAIYPNPVSETLKIEGLTAGKEKVTINIYDVLGKVVLTQENAAAKSIPVNVKALTKGSYFVEIISGSQRAGKQVIKL